MKNSVLAITGATSGIGRALAIEGARRGARIAACARNADQLESLRLEVEALGQPCLCMTVDVSQESQCQQFIQAIEAQYGQLDVLINNAGISMRALFHELDLNVLKQVMDVNFWGTAFCSRYAMPLLLKSQGSLVGISSVAGFQGLPGRTGYCASKFAVHGLLEAIRLENLASGLHVLICCPGFTASNIRNTALNAQGKPQGESPRDEQKMMTAAQVAIHTLNAVVQRKPKLVLTAQGKLTYFLGKFLPSFINKQVVKVFDRENKSK
ncbi:MAG: SDR family oxidoreductase [Bacteroidia bacterium]|jgi:short-subunit dehydrogenase